MNETDDYSNVQNGSKVDETPTRSRGYKKWNWTKEDTTSFRYSDLSTTRMVVIWKRELIRTMN